MDAEVEVELEWLVTVGWGNRGFTGFAELVERAVESLLWQGGAVFEAAEIDA